MEQLDQNIQYEIKGTILNLTVDMSKDFGRTGGGTGKNLSVATTHGGTRVGSIVANLNFYKKP